MMHTLRPPLIVGGLTASLLALSGAPAARSADHGDMPQLTKMGRSDAMLTDLHVFRRGDRLVLALSTNPAIPPSVSRYLFPSDLKLRLHIDRHSAVHYDDPAANARFGGTIVRPQGVSADVTLEITFDGAGRPRLKAKGIKGKDRDEIAVFAGLRDDPFIRRPRMGKNVASVVVELPLGAIPAPRSTLLVWATSYVPEFQNPMADHAGRALRSMFDAPMNVSTPRDHWNMLGEMPDVVIFNVDWPAGFPNGRELTDDVVDLVADMPGPLMGEAPTFPTENDVPFLDEFPYLAPPHPAP